MERFSFSEQHPGISISRDNIPIAMMLIIAVKLFVNTSFFR